MKISYNYHKTYMRIDFWQKWGAILFNKTIGTLLIHAHHFAVQPIMMPVSIFIELPTTIVEAMHEFMTQNSSKRAIIKGSVFMKIENYKILVRIRLMLITMKYLLQAQIEEWILQNRHRDCWNFSKAWF